METKKIVIPGTPPSSIHAYRFTRKGAYLTWKGVKFKKAALHAFLQQYGLGKALKGPVELWVTYYFGNKRRHDVDNYSKLTLDSAKKLLYVDDEQVQRLHLEKKMDKENPRTEIVFCVLEKQ